MADDTTIKPEGPTKKTGPKELRGPTKTKRPQELGGPTKTKGSTELEGPIKFKEQTKAGGLTDLRGLTKAQGEELFRAEELEEPWYSKREEPSTEFKNVLNRTRILHIMDEYSYVRQRQEAKTTRSKDTEGEKTGHTMFKGENIRLPVKWKSLDDETHLMIDNLGLFSHHFMDFISILCPMCPVVRHVSISFDGFVPFLRRGYMGKPSTEGMKSVRTVCVVMDLGILSDVLLIFSKYFPNAESLDAQWKKIVYLDSSYRISSSKVNHSSVLKKLKLTAHEMRFPGTSEVEYLFLGISNIFPNITSLVISDFTSLHFNQSTKDLPWKLPYLTNIQLDPGVGDFYPFETLSYVLNLTSVEIPQLELFEANKVSLEPGTNMPLASVTWSRLSSGCELKLKDASATVPLVDLIQLVSNELKGVTSLRLDRCNIVRSKMTGLFSIWLSEKFAHQKKKLGEGSSLLELTLFNMKSPLLDADIQNLSEMYPDVKITVVHGSNVSHDVAGEHRLQPDPDDSQLGKGKTGLSERQTSFTSLSMKDELGEAAARIQIHDDQTNTQGALQGQEERETGDEVTATPIRMECCKRVGVEGDKLQLETFGIELDIPPGAIDSETPQEISLRVLTDTPNLGNSEEFSVCFGVQCLAPDDLVLKHPVTYTIPHCAAFTRISSVDAVLYTGDGEYTPDAVVKQCIQLQSSGIPSCTIMKDVFKLKMNHFSWAKIKLRVKNFFFRGKRMCCQPFAESTLPEQRKQVILRTYLYDDIPGNREKIERNEEKQDFNSVHPEIQILIKTAAVDLSMTCYIQEEIIGGPAVVDFDRLNSGTRICEPFTLNFTNHSDQDAVVSLKVGQTKKLEVNLTFRLKFPTILSTLSCTTQDKVKTEGASSTQAIRSPKSKGEKSLNPSPKKKAKLSIPITSTGQEDFDEMLRTVAKRVTKNTEIDCLGKKLGFDPTDIDLYRNANRKDSDVSYMGTLTMLRDWRKKQTKATEHAALKLALEGAGQRRLAAQLFEK